MTNRVVIRRAINGSSSRVAGTWFYGKIEGIPVVVLCCPSCGKPSSLVDHEISESGLVAPEVLCLHCHKFSGEVQLDHYQHLNS